MIPPMKRRKDQFRLDHQDRKRDEEKGSDVVFKFRAAVNFYTALKHAAPCLRELCVRGSIRDSISVVLAFACPAVGKFSRASSAGGRLNLRSNIKHPDCVGRRGLSEPREDFSRLLTHTIRGCIRGSIRGSLSVALALACPAVGKFSRASSAGGRLNL